MVIWSVQYLRRSADLEVMKSANPEFSSELFDTFAKIASQNEVIYFGSGQKLKRQRLTEKRTKELQVDLLLQISGNIGKHKLSKLDAGDVLGAISVLQEKISKKTRPFNSGNLEINNIVPPLEHTVLFFLVCASADVELNGLKKKLRTRLREMKRHKSGKSADVFSSAILDLQTLSSTGHWHNHTHENPVPDGVLHFVDKYNQFKFFVTKTLRGFEDGQFPDKLLIENLNKGRRIYQSWAIQNLVDFLTALEFENSTAVATTLLKQVLGKNFSITPYLKMKRYGHLPDPHMIYIQLQNLMICTRLIPS